MLKKSEAFISLFFFFLPGINQKIATYIYIYSIYMHTCMHACMHTHIHALTIWVARGGSMLVLVES